MKEMDTESTDPSNFNDRRDGGYHSEISAVGRDSGEKTARSASVIGAENLVKREEYNKNSSRQVMSPFEENSTATSDKSPSVSRLRKTSADHSINTAIVGTSTVTQGDPSKRRHSVSGAIFTEKCDGSQSNDLGPCFLSDNGPGKATKCSSLLSLATCHEGTVKASSSVMYNPNTAILNNSHYRQFNKEIDVNMGKMSECKVKTETNSSPPPSCLNESFRKDKLLAGSSPPKKPLSKFSHRPKSKIEDIVQNLRVQKSLTAGILTFNEPEKDACFKSPCCSERSARDILDQSISGKTNHDCIKNKSTVHSEENTTSKSVPIPSSGECSVTRTLSNEPLCDSRVVPDTEQGEDQCNITKSSVETIVKATGKEPTAALEEEAPSIQVIKHSEPGNAEQQKDMVSGVSDGMASRTDHQGPMERESAKCVIQDGDLSKNQQIDSMFPSSKCVKDQSCNVSKSSLSECDDDIQETVRKCLNDLCMKTVSLCGEVSLFNCGDSVVNSSTSNTGSEDSSSECVSIKCETDASKSDCAFPKSEVNLNLNGQFCLQKLVCDKSEDNEQKSLTPLHSASEEGSKIAKNVTEDASVRVSAGSDSVIPVSVNKKEAHTTSQEATERVDVVSKDVSKTEEKQKLFEDVAAKNKTEDKTCQDKEKTKQEVPDTNPKSEVVPKVQANIFSLFPDYLEDISSESDFDDYNDDVIESGEITKICDTKSKDENNKVNSAQAKGNEMCKKMAPVIVKDKESNEKCPLKQKTDSMSKVENTKAFINEVSEMSEKKSNGKACMSDRTNDGAILCQENSHEQEKLGEEVVEDQEQLTEDNRVKCVKLLKELVPTIDKTNTWDTSSTAASQQTPLLPHLPCRLPLTKVSEALESCSKTPKKASETLDISTESSNVIDVEEGTHSSLKISTETQPPKASDVLSAEEENLSNEAKSSVSRDASDKVGTHSVTPVVHEKALDINKIDISVGIADDTSKTAQHSTISMVGPSKALEHSVQSSESATSLVDSDVSSSSTITNMPMLGTVIDSSAIPNSLEEISKSVPTDTAAISSEAVDIVPDSTTEATSAILEMESVISKSDMILEVHPSQTPSSNACSPSLVSSSLALNADDESLTVNVISSTEVPNAPDETVRAQPEEKCSNVSSGTEGTVPENSIASEESPVIPTKSALVSPSNKFLFQIEPIHLMKLGDGQKLYACDICSGVYQRAFSLKRHYLRSHINYRYLTERDISNCGIVTGDKMAVQCGNNTKICMQNSKITVVPDFLSNEDSSQTVNISMTEDEVTAANKTECKLDQREVSNSATPEENVTGRIQEDVKAEDNLSENKSEESDSIKQKPASTEGNCKESTAIDTARNLLGLYRCHICGTCFEDKVELVKHITDHPVPPTASVGEAKPHTCTQCNASFTHKNNYLRHCASQAHNTQSLRMSDNKRAYLCLYCNKDFSSTAIRKRHQSRIHQNQKKIKRRRRPQHGCPFCAKPTKFRELTALKKHLMSVHTDVYHICTICDERFESKTILNEHVERGHEKIKFKFAKLGKAVDDMKSVGVKSSENEIKGETVISKDNPDVNTQLILKEDGSKLVLNRKEPLVENGRNMGVKHDEGANMDSLNCDETNFHYTCAVCQKMFITYVNMCRHNRLAHGRMQGSTTKKSKHNSRSSSCTDTVSVASSGSRSQSPLDVNLLPVSAKKSSPKRSQSSSQLVHNLQGAEKVDQVIDEQVMDAEMLFYSRLSGNIRDNLLNHLDGKLHSKENVQESKDLISTSPDDCNMQESSSNISNMNSELSSPTNTQDSVQEENAVTKAVQIEKSTKNADRGAVTSTHKVFWEKYNFPKNYNGRGAGITSYIKDMSHLDIHTQLAMRQNLQRMNSNSSDSSEDVPLSTMICEEQQNRLVIDFPAELHLIEKVNICKKEIQADTSKKPISKAGSSSSETKESKPTDEPRRITRRKSDLEHKEKELSQEQEAAAGKNGGSSRRSSVEDLNITVLSGEWVRPRSYVCAACSARFADLWDLEDHKHSVHPNVWCTHYEFDETAVFGTATADEKASERVLPVDLCRRYLLPDGALKAAQAIPPTVASESKCTKCSRVFHNLPDLHYHMLECGGDTTWMLTMLMSSPGASRRNRKWRPFGSRRRRQQGRRGMKRNIPSTPVKIPQYRSRHRAGDTDTIQRMIANLPAKRSTRRVIQFTEDEIKTRSQGTIHSVSFAPSFSRSSYKNGNSRSAYSRTLSPSTNNEPGSKKDGKQNRPMKKKTVPAPVGSLSQNSSPKKVARPATPTEGAITRAQLNGNISVTTPAVTNTVLNTSKCLSAKKSVGDSTNLKEKGQHPTENVKAGKSLSPSKKSMKTASGDSNSVLPSQINTENKKPESAATSLSPVRGRSSKRLLAIKDVRSSSTGPDTNTERVTRNVKRSLSLDHKKGNKKLVACHTNRSILFPVDDDRDISMTDVLEKSSDTIKGKNTKSNLKVSPHLSNSETSLPDIEDKVDNDLSTNAKETSTILAAMKHAMMESPKHLVTKTSGTEEVTNEGKSLSVGKRTRSSRSCTEMGDNIAVKEKKKGKQNQNDREEKKSRNKAYPPLDDSANDPIICDGCGAQFDNISTCERHRKKCIYQKPSEVKSCSSNENGSQDEQLCHKCGRSFSYTSSFWKHIKSCTALISTDVASKLVKKNCNVLLEKPVKREAKGASQSPVKQGDSAAASKKRLVKVLALEVHVSPSGSDIDDKMPELEKVEPIENVKRVTRSKRSEDLTDIPILSPVSEVDNAAVETLNPEEEIFTPELHAGTSVADKNTKRRRKERNVSVNDIIDDTDTLTDDSQQKTDVSAKDVTLDNEIPLHGGHNQPSEVAVSQSRNRSKSASKITVLDNVKLSKIGRSPRKRHRSASDNQKGKTEYAIPMSKLEAQFAEVVNIIDDSQESSILSSDTDMNEDKYVTSIPVSNHDQSKKCCTSGNVEMEVDILETIPLALRNELVDSEADSPVKEVKTKLKKKRTSNKDVNAVLVNQNSGLRNTEQLPEDVIEGTTNEASCIMPVFEGKTLVMKKQNKGQVNCKRDVSNSVPAVEGDLFQKSSDAHQKGENVEELVPLNDQEKNKQKRSQNKAEKLKPETPRENTIQFPNGNTSTEIAEISHTNECIEDDLNSIIKQRNNRSRKQSDFGQSKLELDASNLSQSMGNAQFSLSIEIPQNAELIPENGISANAQEKKKRKSKSRVQNNQYESEKLDPILFGVPQSDELEEINTLKRIKRKKKCNVIGTCSQLETPELYKENFTESITVQKKKRSRKQTKEVKPDLEIPNVELQISEHICSEELVGTLENDLPIKNDEKKRNKSQTNSSKSEIGMSHGFSHSLESAQSDEMQEKMQVCESLNIFVQKRSNKTKNLPNSGRKNELKTLNTVVEPSLELDELSESAAVDGYKQNKTGKSKVKDSTFDLGTSPISEHLHSEEMNVSNQTVTFLADGTSTTRKIKVKKNKHQMKSANPETEGLCLTEYFLEKSVPEENLNNKQPKRQTGRNRTSSAESGVEPSVLYPEKSHAAAEELCDTDTINCSLQDKKHSKSQIKGAEIFVETSTPETEKLDGTLTGLSLEEGVIKINIQKKIKKNKLHVKASKIGLGASEIMIQSSECFEHNDTKHNSEDIHKDTFVIGDKNRKNKRKASEIRESGSNGEVLSTSELHTGVQDVTGNFKLTEYFKGDPVNYGDIHAEQMEEIEMRDSASTLQPSECTHLTGKGQDKKKHRNQTKTTISELEIKKLQLPTEQINSHESYEVIVPNENNDCSKPKGKKREILKKLELNISTCVECQSSGEACETHSEEYLNTTNRRDNDTSVRKNTNSNKPPLVNYVKSVTSFELDETNSDLEDDGKCLSEGESTKCEQKNDKMLKSSEEAKKESKPKMEFAAIAADVSKTRKNVVHLSDSNPSQNEPAPQARKHKMQEKKHSEAKTVKKKKKIPTKPKKTASDLSIVEAIEAVVRLSYNEPEENTLNKDSGKSPEIVPSAAEKSNKHEAIDENRNDDSGALVVPEIIASSNDTVQKLTPDTSGREGDSFCNSESLYPLVTKPSKHLGNSSLENPVKRRKKHNSSWKTTIVLPNNILSAAEDCSPALEAREMSSSLNVEEPLEQCSEQLATVNDSCVSGIAENGGNSFMLHDDGMPILKKKCKSRKKNIQSNKLIQPENEAKNNREFIYTEGNLTAKDTCLLDNIMGDSENKLVDEDTLPISKLKDPMFMKLFRMRTVMVKNTNTGDLEEKQENTESEIATAGDTVKGTDVKEAKSANDTDITLNCIENISEAHGEVITAPNENEVQENAMNEKKGDDNSEVLTRSTRRGRKKEEISLPIIGRERSARITRWNLSYEEMYTSSDVASETDSQEFDTSPSDTLKDVANEALKKSIPHRNGRLSNKKNKKYAGKTKNIKLRWASAKYKKLGNRKKRGFGTKNASQEVELNAQMSEVPNTDCQPSETVMHKESQHEIRVTINLPEKENSFVENECCSIENHQQQSDKVESITIGRTHTNTADVYDDQESPKSEQKQAGNVMGNELPLFHSMPKTRKEKLKLNLSIKLKNAKEDIDKEIPEQCQELQSTTDDLCESNETEPYTSVFGIGKNDDSLDHVQGDHVLEKKLKRKSSLGSKYYCALCRKHYSTSFNLSKHKLSIFHTLQERKKEIRELKDRIQNSSKASNTETRNDSMPLVDLLPKLHKYNGLKGDKGDEMILSYEKSKYSSGRSFSSKPKLVKSIKDAQKNKIILKIKTDNIQKISQMELNIPETKTKSSDVSPSQKQDSITDNELNVSATETAHTKDDNCVADVTSHQEERALNTEEQQVKKTLSAGCTEESATLDQPVSASTDRGIENTAENGPASNVPKTTTDVAGVTLGWPLSEESMPSNDMSLLNEESTPINTALADNYETFSSELETQFSSVPSVSTSTSCSTWQQMSSKEGDWFGQTTLQYQADQLSWPNGTQGKESSWPNEAGEKGINWSEHQQQQSQDPSSQECPLPQKSPPLSQPSPLPQQPPQPSKDANDMNWTNEQQSQAESWTDSQRISESNWSEQNQTKSASWPSDRETLKDVTGWTNQPDQPAIVSWPNQSGNVEWSSVQEGWIGDQSRTWLWPSGASGIEWGSQQSQSGSVENQWTGEGDGGQYYSHMDSNASLGSIMDSVNQVLDCNVMAPQSAPLVPEYTHYTCSDNLVAPNSNSLHDLQKAMGATDEEMAILENLGEGTLDPNWPLENAEIMDLDHQQSATPTPSDEVTLQENIKERKDDKTIPEKASTSNASSSKKQTLPTQTTVNRHGRPKDNSLSRDLSLMHEYQDKEMVCPLCHRFFLGLTALQTHVSSTHNREQVGKAPRTSARSRKSLSSLLSPVPNENSTTSPRVLCSLCRELLQDEVALARHREELHNQQGTREQECKIRVRREETAKAASESGVTEDPEAEGLKIQMSTALGDLFDRALNNMLEKGRLSVGKDGTGLNQLNLLQMTFKRSMAAEKKKEDHETQPSTSKYNTALAKKCRQELGGRRSSCTSDRVEEGKAVVSETTQERPFACPICDDRFLILSSRNRHIARAHNNRVMSAEERSSVSSPLSLMTSTEDPSEEPSLDELDSWREASPADWTTEPAEGDGGTGSFLCSDCGINFETPQDVLRHRKLEHSSQSQSAGTMEMNKSKMQQQTLVAAQLVTHEKASEKVKQKNKPEKMEKQLQGLSKNSPNEAQSENKSKVTGAGNISAVTQKCEVSKVISPKGIISTVCGTETNNLPEPKPEISSKKEDTLPKHLKSGNFKSAEREPKELSVVKSCTDLTSVATSAEGVETSITKQERNEINMPEGELKDAAESSLIVGESDVTTISDEVIASLLNVNVTDSSCSGENIVESMKDSNEMPDKVTDHLISGADITSENVSSNSDNTEVSPLKETIIVAKGSTPGKLSRSKSSSKNLERQLELCEDGNTIRAKAEAALRELNSRKGRSSTNAGSKWGLKFTVSDSPKEKVAKKEGEGVQSDYHKKPVVSDRFNFPLVRKLPVGSSRFASLVEKKKKVAPTAVINVQKCVPIEQERKSPGISVEAEILKSAMVIAADKSAFDVYEFEDDDSASVGDVGFRPFYQRHPDEKIKECESREINEGNETELNTTDETTEKAVQEVLNSDQLKNINDCQDEKGLESSIPVQETVKTDEIPHTTDEGQHFAHNSTSVNDNPEDVLENHQPKKEHCKLEVKEDKEEKSEKVKDSGRHKKSKKSSHNKVRRQSCAEEYLFGENQTSPEECHKYEHQESSMDPSILVHDHNSDKEIECFIKKSKKDRIKREHRKRKSSHKRSEKNSQANVLPMEGSLKRKCEKDSPNKKHNKLKKCNGDANFITIEDNEMLHESGDDSSGRASDVNKRESKKHTKRRRLLSESSSDEVEDLETSRRTPTKYEHMKKRHKKRKQRFSFGGDVSVNLFTNNPKLSYDSDDSFTLSTGEVINKKRHYVDDDDDETTNWSSDKGEDPNERIRKAAARRRRTKSDLLISVFAKSKRNSMMNNSVLRSKSFLSVAPINCERDLSSSEESEPCNKHISHNLLKHKSRTVTSSQVL